MDITKKLKTNAINKICNGWARGNEVLGSTKSPQLGDSECWSVVWAFVKSAILELRKLHRENTVHADDPLRFAGDQYIGAEVLLSVRQSAVDRFLNMHDLIIWSNKTLWTYMATNLVFFTVIISAYT